MRKVKKNGRSTFVLVMGYIGDKNLDVRWYVFRTTFNGVVSFATCYFLYIDSSV